METFKFYDVQQNTDEWLQLRSGKFTSSKAGTIMANDGKAFGDPAKKYAVNLAIEQITGHPIPQTFSNAHMERGHEQEPVARALYEYETFSGVDNGGFFGSDFVGCSPDGLVGDDGVIEIKSVIAAIHYANLKRGDIDPAYKWQCVSNLLFTDRKWLDFVSYCEEFPVGKRLFVKRIYAKDLDTEFNSVLARVRQLRVAVDAAKKIILESEYTIH